MSGRAVSSRPAGGGAAIQSEREGRAAARVPGSMSRAALFCAFCLPALTALPAQQPTPPVPGAAIDRAPFDLDAAFTAAMPPTAEARWTLIPWRESLTDALVEAKATGKPVYLYVNDGRVAPGRC